MLSVTYAEYLVQALNAECRQAKCRNAVCRSAEYCGAILKPLKVKAQSYLQKRQ